MSRKAKNPHMEWAHFRFSVIGGKYGEPGHNVSYPEWWHTAGAYLLVSFVVLTGGGILRRHRIMRLRRSGG